MRQLDLSLMKISQYKFGGKLLYLNHTLLLFRRPNIQGYNSTEECLCWNLWPRRRWTGRKACKYSKLKTLYPQEFRGDLLTKIYGLLWHIVWTAWILFAQHRSIFIVENTLSPLNKGLFQIRVYITANVYAGIVKVNPSGKLVIQRYVDKFFCSRVKFTARTIEAIRTKLTYTFIIYWLNLPSVF